MDDQQGAAPAGNVQEQDEKLNLPWGAVLIVVLPLIVFFLSDKLISAAGMPVDGMPPLVAFNGDAEAAGRLRVLATFFLLAGAATATLAYLIFSLQRLNRTSWWLVMAPYLLVVIVGSVMLVAAPHRETQEFVGQRLVCTTLSLPGPPVLRPIEADRPPPSVSNPADCQAPHYLLLRHLIEAERLLLLFAIPAVVLGAVTSLAQCSEALPADRQREFRYARIEQLNTALYLAALLLVIGLLFVGAFLQWPGFALGGEAFAAYRSHAGGIVLFYGATYSVLLASYYIPTFVFLSREPKLPEPCAPSGREGPSLIPPLVLVRAGAAVFAPVVVSILGEVMHLPT